MAGFVWYRKKYTEFREYCSYICVMFRNILGYDSKKGINIWRDLSLSKLSSIE